MGGRGVYLRVGLFILGGLALLVGLIWFLAGGRVGRGPLFESYFSELVQGLDAGAAVKFRGVTIGRVSELGLVNAEYGRGEGIERDLLYLSPGLRALRRRHREDRPGAGHAGGGSARVADQAGVTGHYGSQLSRARFRRS